MEAVAEQERAQDREQWEGEPDSGDGGQEVLGLTLKELDVHPEAGVRQTAVSEESDKGMVASIASLGLIQNIAVVRNHSTVPHEAPFLVVAGVRRFEAIQTLFMRGDWPEDRRIRCAVVQEEDAVQISFAENVVRVEMSMADEIEAFSAMVDQGATVGEIATRFAYAPRTVRQRIRLAGCHPEVLSAFREGEVTLDGLGAFASTRKQAQQLHVLERLRKKRDEQHQYSWNLWDTIDADRVRPLLDDTRVSATDGRAQLVGIDAYKEAGGKVDLDLFSDEDDDHLHLRSTELLDELALQRLRDWVGETLLEERWAWVECMVDFPHELRQTYTQANKLKATPTEEEQAEMDRLEAEKKAHYAAKEHAEGRAKDKERTAIVNKVIERDIWPDAVRENAGCVVEVGYRGKPQVWRGLYRPGEEPGAAERAEDVAKGAKGSKKKADPPKGLGGLPASALDTLRALRGDVVAAHLTDDLADRVLTFHLCMKVFNVKSYTQGILAVDYAEGKFNVDGSNRGFDRPRYDPLVDRCGNLSTEWIHADDPWGSFLSLTEAERRELLTMAVASLLIPQLTTDDRWRKKPQYEMVVNALRIDWKSVKATRALLWDRLKKSDLLEAGRRLFRAPWAKERAKLKKGQIVNAMVEEFERDDPAEKVKDFVIPGFAPPGSTE